MTKENTNVDAEKMLNELEDEGVIQKHRTLGQIYSNWEFDPNYPITGMVDHPKNPRKKKDISKLLGTGPVHRALVILASQSAIERYGKPVTLQGHLRSEYCRVQGYPTVPANVIRFEIPVEMEMSILLDHNAETNLRDIMEAYSSVAAGLDAGLTLTQVEKQCMNVFMSCFVDCTKKLDAAEEKILKAAGVSTIAELSDDEKAELMAERKKIQHSQYWGRIQQLKAVYDLPVDLRETVFGMWERGESVPYKELVAIDGKFGKIREEVLDALNDGKELGVSDRLADMLYHLKADLAEAKSDSDKNKIQSAIDYIDSLVESGIEVIDPVTRINYPPALRTAVEAALSGKKTDKTETKRRNKQECTSGVNTLTERVAETKGPEKAYLQGVLDGIRFMECNIETAGILEVAKTYNKPVTK